MGRIRASLENDIFPALGSCPMAALKASEVMEAVKQVEARGAADQAGRVLQRVKAIYRWAVTHQRIDTNPMLDLVPSEILKPRTVQHRAALAEKELPEFMRKLAAYDGAPKHCAGPAHAHAHGLQARGSARRALGGIRPQGGPVDHPRRAHEGMKMREEHRVPLSKQALEVLARIEAISGGRELVFPSPYYPSKPLSENTFNSALARMGYKSIATAHGFRALFSTVANEHGWKPDVIERQLAHREQNEIRAAYHRTTYMTDRIKLMQWWADYLERTGMNSP